MRLLRAVVLISLTVGCPSQHEPYPSRPAEFREAYAEAVCAAWQDCCDPGQHVNEAACIESGTMTLQVLFNPLMLLGGKYQPRAAARCIEDSTELARDCIGNLSCSCADVYDTTGIASGNREPCIDFFSMARLPLQASCEP